MVPGKPLAAQEIWEVCVDALTQEIIGVLGVLCQELGTEIKYTLLTMSHSPSALESLSSQGGNQEAKRLLSSLWAQVYK